jgi:hypothetical protein
MGAIAKAYMRKGFLIYEEMRKYLVILRRPLVIYVFATAPFWISMRKILFSFLSMYLFNTAVSAALQIPLCRQLAGIGLNPVVGKSRPST